MQKQIYLNNQKLEYVFRRSGRARRVRLAVYGDGSLAVTVPRGVDEGVAEKFIIEKSDWIIRKIAYYKKFKNRVVFKNSRADYLKNKKYASRLIQGRIEYFNKEYCFSFGKISIRNQKTRWGSCSKKSNLNFNYKITFLPAKVADYIIVHELCHLGEFNHSQKFWNLVAETIPDYRGARKELRDGFNL